MEKVLNDYLETMENHLKPVPVSERVDIINEIKSEMLELQSSGVSAEKITERLGDPKELAKAYLGDLISKESGFSWTRFLMVCCFYSLVGFSGMFVIPCLGIIAPTFILCGIAAPVLVAIKMIDYLLALNLPYVQHIGIFLNGVVVFHPVVEFLISLLIGALLYWLGRAAWKVLVLYCKKVSRTAGKLTI